jgi:hypothetical protein
VTERGIKTQSGLAQALVGGAEQVVVGDAVAVGETPRLLPRQVEVGYGELALFGTELAGAIAVPRSWWCCSGRKS